MGLCGSGKTLAFCQNFSSWFRWTVEVEKQYLLLFDKSDLMFTIMFGEL